MRKTALSSLKVVSALTRPSFLSYGHTISKGMQVCPSQDRQHSHYQSISTLLKPRQGQHEYLHIPLVTSQAHTSDLLGRMRTAFLFLSPSLFFPSLMLHVFSTIQNIVLKVPPCSTVTPESTSLRSCGLFYFNTSSFILYCVFATPS